MYGRRYAADPRWMDARFGSSCHGCGAAIEKGSRIFYYPSGKAAYGEKCGCGETHSRDFEAAAFDEDAMGGGF